MNRKIILIFLIFVCTGTFLEYSYIKNGFKFIYTSVQTFKSSYLDRKCGNAVYFKNINTDICYNKINKTCFYLSHERNNTDSSVRKKSLDISLLKDEINILLNDKKKNTSCNRFITIRTFQGRLGNQMFQAASLIGTAYRYDIIPIIPATNQLQEYFDLPSMMDSGAYMLSNVETCKNLESAKYYNCKKEIETGKNISMVGYLQSWKYFFEAYDVVKSVFKFKKSYLTNAKAFLSKMSLAGYKRVCIHVRRGDVTDIRHQEYGYGFAGIDFIEKAKQYFKNMYSRVQFFVVSNDKKWCRQNIEGVYVSTFSDRGDDLALMYLSDNVVVTTGSFGWWGAMLSGGTAVYFDKAFRAGSELASQMNSKDYYPPNWIGLS